MLGRDASASSGDVRLNQQSNTSESEVVFASRITRERYHHPRPWRPVEAGRVRPRHFDLPYAPRIPYSYHVSRSPQASSLPPRTRGVIGQGAPTSPQPASRPSSSASGSYKAATHQPKAGLPKTDRQQLALLAHPPQRHHRPPRLHALDQLGKGTHFKGLCEEKGIYKKLEDVNPLMEHRIRHIHNLPCTGHRVPRVQVSVKQDTGDSLPISCRRTPPTLHTRTIAT